MSQQGWQDGGGGLGVVFKIGTLLDTLQVYIL